MATINQEVTIGGNDTGTAGQIETITLNGHQRTSVATDTDALSARTGAFNVGAIEVEGNGHLIGNDVTIVGEGFTVDRAFPTANTAYTMNDSTWVYTSDGVGSGGQIQFDLRGRIRLANHKIIMSVPNNILYFFGTSENAQNFVPVFNNVELINNGQGVMVFHTGSMDHTATDIQLNGISAVDGVTAQLKGFGSVFGFSLGAGTSTQNIDGAYSGNWNYNTRIVHQGSLDASGGNVSNTGVEVDLPQGNYTRWTNWDASISAGNTNAGGTSGTILQLNRNVAMWLVNPDFGTATSNQHIGFHSGNPPGRANSATRGSELRVLFAHRPQFRDAATLEPLPNALPTKVHYNTFTLAHNDFDSTTIPTRVNVRDEIELGTGGFANNGEGQVMVRDQYFRWTNTRVLNIRTEGTTSTNVAANLPRNQGGRDPALAQNTIFNTNDRTVGFQVRNFYYDFTLENEVGTDTSPATSDAVYTVANYDGTDVREFLNSRDHDTDLSDSRDAADWYAKVRQAWYNTDFNVIRAFPMEASGTTLTFLADGRFSTTAATSIADTEDRDITINNPSVTVLRSGVFDTFDFTNRVYDWNGISFPAGGTIVAGTHSAVGGLANVTWTASNNPSIQVGLAAGTYTFAQVFGNPTGNFTASSSNAITVTATAAEVSQITLLTGSNITFNIVLSVTGGSTDANSRIQVFELDGDGDVTGNDIVPGTEGVASETVTLTAGDGEISGATDYRVVWTQPGFDHYSQDVNIGAGGTFTVNITQTATVAAQPATGLPVGGSVEATWDNTNSRINFAVSGLRGSSQSENSATGTQTNALWESAKADAGYGEGVARLGLTNQQQVIQHGATNTTSFRDTTYFLDTGQAGNTQFVAETREIPFGGGSPTSVTAVGAFTGTLSAADGGGSFSAASVTIGTDGTGISLPDATTLLTNTTNTINNHTTAVGGAVVLDEESQVNDDFIIDVVRRSGAV